MPLILRFPSVSEVIPIILLLVKFNIGAPFDPELIKHE